MLHRHQFNCMVSDRHISTSALLTQSDMICGRLDVEASTGLQNEVFPYMLNDVIGKIARADKLIISLGNIWLEKNVGNKLKRGKYTSQIMRLTARLLCNLREINENEEIMSNYLKPAHFNDIAKATLMTAGASKNDEENLEKPSNAIKLGHDIKKLINIKIGLAILKKDDQSKEEGRDLLQVMQIFWATRITKLARVTLHERQFNKRPVLPDASDIEKLNNYLKLEMRMIDLKRIDIENYKHITKLVSAKLLMYNRRRTGEIEAIGYAILEISNTIYSFRYYMYVLLISAMVSTLTSHRCNPRSILRQGST